MGPLRGRATQRLRAAARRSFVRQLLHGSTRADLEEPQWRDLPGRRQCLVGSVGPGPERSAVRRRSGAPLRDADRALPRGLRVPTQSDRRLDRQRRAGIEAVPDPLQHRTGLLMRALRRLLQAVAIVGTLLVGIVAMSLIVSQTPWFRDWLRRYVVRESKQYLNGDLTIGRLGGNLL